MKNLFENRIKYLIKYDSKKTSKENLFEQDPKDGLSTNTEPSVSSVKTSAGSQPQNIDKTDLISKTENWYLIDCRYPEKAIKPPNTKWGDNGYIEGFCYYKAMGGKGIYLPTGTKIIFYDNEGILEVSNWLKGRLDKRYPEIDHNIKNVMEDLIKLIGHNDYKNVVRQFSLIEKNIIQNDTQRVDYKEYKIGNYVGCYHFESLGVFTFNGYSNSSDRVSTDGCGTFYSSPVRKDDRSTYDYVIDEWGVWIQISVAVATAILTDGLSLSLTPEILTELGLAGLVANREFEKGENVSAVTSIIFGLLPFLKLTKYMRSGISDEVYDGLKNKLLKYNLTNKNTASQYQKFYKSLTEEEKIAFTQILEQDPLTRRQMIKDINNALKSLPSKTGQQLSKTGQETINQIKTLITTNKSLAKQTLKNLTYWQKLWVRELGANGLVLLLGSIIDLFYGEKLNSEIEEKIKGAYNNIPDKLKDELALNLLTNYDLLEEIVNNKNFEQLTLPIQNKNSIEYVELEKRILKIAIEEPGGKYSKINDEKIEPIKLSDKELDDLRNQGFKPESEVNWNLERDDELKVVDSDKRIIWYKTHPK